MMRIAVVLGTRPEAIKLAPLILEMRKHAQELDVQVVFSGQHRHLVGPILDFFGIQSQRALDLMQPNQTLASLTGKAVPAFDTVFSEMKPDWVIVQGDTTTAMAAALAAFYLKIPVAHLEAGLRTRSIYSPFPEEINRRVIGQIAALHWAPTQFAAEALAKEQLPIPPAKVFVTGNTVIDSLLSGVARIRKAPIQDADCDYVAARRRQNVRVPMILITGHRRENFGEPFKEFCEALKESGARHPEAVFIYPVHPNPNVRAPVEAILSGLPNIRLTEPKHYAEFLQLLDLSDLVVTDSGGVQEEAPALGKPVLVTRDTTERPEGLATGHVHLVGARKKELIEAIDNYLTGYAQGLSALAPAFPYGDGHASERCVSSLLGQPFTPFSF